MFLRCALSKTDGTPLELMKAKTCSHGATAIVTLEKFVANNSIEQLSYRPIYSDSATSTAKS